MNICETVLTSTPMPTWLPRTRPMAEATRSANSARDDFMPTVLALAMLLPMTSRLRLAAFKPERPVWNAHDVFLCRACVG